MRVVSPYRPFAPESPAHRRLGPFAWERALACLATSVARACQCETCALTDLATRLPVPSFQYATREPRLMLWILEVSLAYLASADFDRDTVMVSPDILIYGDLRMGFREADLAVLVRAGAKYARRPLLNGVQWWAVAAQPRLIAFYHAALMRARELPASAQVWGADTLPLVDLLAPLEVGVMMRRGLRVRGLPHTSVLTECSTRDIAMLQRTGRVPFPVVPIVDFKGLRKHNLFAYFDATLGAGVPA